MRSALGTTPWTRSTRPPTSPPRPLQIREFLGTTLHGSLETLLSLTLLGLGCPCPHCDSHESQSTNQVDLTWTQIQSGLGMLKSVDPSSPLSSQSQLCQHQPLPHQISFLAEISKTDRGFKNSPAIKWSASKERTRSGSGKQGKLATPDIRELG